MVACENIREEKIMKKYLRCIQSVFAIILICCCVCSVNIRAKTSDLKKTSQEIVIEKFDTENLNNTSFNFYKSKKPKLDELLDMFPKELAVYLKGKTTISKIPVTWECVGDDFEKSESYYFQFSPKWDKKYVLDKSLNKLKDAPYITARVLPDPNLKKRSVSGNSNETTIYNYLINNMKLNTAAACGVLANIQAESSFNPDLKGDYQNGQYTSYGICQWHADRWTNLKNYCNKNGYSWTTLNGQLNYLKYELSTNQYNYIYRYLKGDRKSVV